MDKLLTKGMINKYVFFLENYKFINITDSEAIVLLHIFKIQEEHKYKLSYEKIREFVSFDKVQLDKILESIVKKELIEINYKKTLKIDVSNIWVKIFKLLEQRKDEELLDITILKMETIIARSLKVDEISFVQKIINTGKIEIITKIINKLNDEGVKINFQTLEKTVNSEIEEIDKSQRLLDYNWLSAK